MGDFLREYQIYILLSCGLGSLLLAAFSKVINFRSHEKKKALIHIELCAALLLIADALAYMYRGNVSTVGIVMTRISNFIVFAAILIVILFLNKYVVALFMETGRFERTPKRLRWGYIVPSLGLVLLVVSQFTGIYYSFNSENLYKRGVLFPVSFLFPGITLLLILSFVIQYRNYIDIILSISVILYGICPLLAGIIQCRFYGFSIMNLSVWFAGLVLFFFALMSQNKELTRAANTDRATGLPNPFGFFEAVNRIIVKGDIAKYNGFYFDIVHMSQINSKYGNETGDEVIYKYADYIHKFTDSDEILGRLGGNYFVALIKKKNTEAFLELLADTPIDIVFNGHREVIHVSAVAGVYEADDSEKIGEQIVGHCAAALFYAKNEAHKPYVFWNEDLQQQFVKMRLLEEDLRKGLYAGEFEPFYQPKVDSRGNILVGAEALTRWRHNGKVIFPQEFIPLMEKKSIICDLDFYMLERVCSDIKEWIDNGIEPVMISINFSRKNLGNPVLAEAISKTIEKYNIPGDLVQIEITETNDEYPMSYLSGVVEALHRYGHQAAIDDFGVGSSSIALLAQVEFDVLKIDKSFIDYKDEKGRQLLKDIIQMAGNMGISVLAEGVESPRRVEELKQMGCYEIQGYVFDNALDKSVFEERLKDREYKNRL